MLLLFSNWRPAQQVNFSFRMEDIDCRHMSRHDEDKQKGLGEDGTRSSHCTVQVVLEDCPELEWTASFESPVSDSPCFLLDTEMSVIHCCLVAMCIHRHLQ
jgi:hypothetical protein